MKAKKGVRLGQQKCTSSKQRSHGDGKICVLEGMNRRQWLRRHLKTIKEKTFIVDKISLLKDKIRRESLHVQKRMNFETLLKFDQVNKIKFD